MPFLRALLLLPLLATSGIAGADACPDNTTLQLVEARFTSMVRSQQPQDRLLYLSPGMREVYLHATTRGHGRILYRWFRDGKRVIDVGVDVGNGTDLQREWHTWSRLRIPPPVPGDVRVQILSAGSNCLLQELTLVSTAYVDHPRIREALIALAADDVVGAKIALKLLIEDTQDTGLARAARRLLENDIVVAGAQAQARNGELFLVEETLRSVEKRLGNAPIDRALRERIATIRALTHKERLRLRREDAHMGIAARHLLETEKLFTGDYPLWREDAERLIAPALLKAGDQFVLVDWKPTLRGYQLVLQDKRSGEAFEVTPD
ncbi:MAG: hypothetical protein ACOY3X_01765 [Pseudomonadota bacterium]